MQPPGLDDTEAFQSNRPVLLALAYRMLGDIARAEDAVQEGCDSAAATAFARACTICYVS